MKKELVIENGKKYEKRTHYLNKKLWLEEYILNGKMHRENGAALILYNIDGTISDKNYYLNGIQITDDLQIMVILGLEDK